MKELPLPEENPDGLHQMYRIEKTNGETIEDDAFYFVLRLDQKSEQEEPPRHVKASRRAALLYAAIVEKTEPKLAAELREAVYGLIEAETDGDAPIPDEVILGGVYTHFRNKKDYVVTGVSLDTDTGSKRVQYTRLWGGEDRRVWSRLYDEFVGTVKDRDQVVVRFKFNQMCDWDSIGAMLPTEDTNQYQLGFELEIGFRSLRDQEALFKFLKELDQFLMTLGLVDEAGSGGLKHWVSHISQRGGNFFDVSETQLKAVTAWCGDHSAVNDFEASSLKNLWVDNNDPKERAS